MEEIRSKYQKKNYREAWMTEIDCPCCKGTFIVDLGYSPIKHGDPKYDTRDFAQVFCPYCLKEIWYTL